jgi:DnaJ-class molecular chaperone
VIEGQGMKVYKAKDHMDEEPERGDLFVIFEIEFPKKLNSDQRDKI